jgi:hypothetical protein
VYTLKVEYIRVCPVHPGRFVHAVKIKDQFITGTSLCRTLVEGYYFLVIAVHEVDFKSFYSQSGVMLADVFHIAVKCVKAGP